jgi:hypothetical protein
MTVECGFPSTWSRGWLWTRRLTSNHMIDLENYMVEVDDVMARWRLNGPKTIPSTGIKFKETHTLQSFLYDVNTTAGRHLERTKDDHFYFGPIMKKTDECVQTSAWDEPFCDMLLASLATKFLLDIWLETSVTSPKACSSEVFYTIWHLISIITAHLKCLYIMHVYICVSLWWVLLKGHITHSHIFTLRVHVCMPCESTGYRWN